AGGATDVLVVVVHHIAADGWSVGILERELAALYVAAVAGGEADLRAANQYPDYAFWQGQRRQAGDSARGLEYWCDYLGAESPAAGLPVDFPRRPGRGVRGESVGVRVPVADARALAAFCRERSMTHFAALAAALGVLLCRLSGQA